MTDAATRVTRVARELDVSLDVSETLQGSMSGSHVHSVSRADGSPAVLKISTAADGGARRAAERELAFYLHLRSQVPIRTPELLAHRQSADTIAILLARHPAPRPAIDWSHTQWLNLAEDLAALHQIPIPSGPEWRRPSWMAAELGDPDLEMARSFWSLPGEPELIEPILTDVAALQEAIGQPADCLLHGDCHTDNILIDQGHLIWTDWQAAGAGNPATELAFPSVRATPGGATLPQAEMIRTYAGRRGLDPVHLGRATLAAELAIFLFTWPPFASYNSPAGIRRVHERVQLLAQTWLAG